jgi:chloramphenicol O-acetyltransferase type B
MRFLKLVMIEINYTNMPVGSSKLKFTVRYLLNILRTYYLLNIRYPWVTYKGFVRIMPGVDFAKFNINIGNNVQFGRNCSVSSDVTFGNYILVAGNVNFVGRNDHTFNFPGKTIWDSPRGERQTTFVSNDVWIGNNSTILAGVRLGNGCIIGANSLVTKDVPDCEIWAGNPAKKIKDRFDDPADKTNHIVFLDKLQNN